ncbi:hypothetical protein, conserved [Trypanosoma cruzi]|uniref:Uncharacterized protein n=1 Tax=Trypanosoma cruzi (strain CL Brener) TaxID=353153 RepID=Q4D7X6_TRYCC|nr:hypothetical protein, conserved [Trypanosoma cruzi]EAN88622.1 hypothetical protein, conserved [Trypanosoma cruzi]|eukprot:XP_810473.1 hypothetical protein [Trypanosoma cruzi strain CL Brener]
MSLRRFFNVGATGKRCVFCVERTLDTCLLQRCFESKKHGVDNDLSTQKLNESHAERPTPDDITASPSTVLRGLQREKKLVTNKVSRDEVSFSPTCHAGKTGRMDDAYTSSGDSNGTNHLDGGARVSTAGNRFLQKLSELENSAVLTPPRSSGFLKLQKRGSEEKVLSERRRMLVFRDVGMDLDKPILSRDVFLVFKYFRYGIEFAVDNELERMLRYFNEHALNELKIIQSSKLMRGPSVLSRKKSVSAHGGGPFQLSPAFPFMQAANMCQFCSYTRETEQMVADLMRPTSPRAFFCRAKEDATANFAPKARYFSEQDLAQMTSFSSSTFRRPAVVIYTQLGQKLGAQADLEWRRLAYKTICPYLLKCLPTADAKGEGHVHSTCEQNTGGLRYRSKEDSVTLRRHSMPFDVVSLRSMDVYKYRWVHRLYVRRFAQSLVPPPFSLEHAATDAQVNGLITASTTFVGCKLLQPFYSVLGLRNYLSPHVMLIDHEGRIRWLTAGCPDDYESEHFPALLKQLEEEYHHAKSR